MLLVSFQNSPKTEFSMKNRSGCAAGRTDGQTRPKQRARENKQDPAKNINYLLTSSLSKNPQLMEKSSHAHNTCPYAVQWEKEDIPECISLK